MSSTLFVVVWASLAQSAPLPRSVQTVCVRGLTTAERDLISSGLTERLESLGVEIVARAREKRRCREEYRTDQAASYVEIRATRLGPFVDITVTIQMGRATKRFRQHWSVPYDELEVRLESVLAQAASVAHEYALEARGSATEEEGPVADDATFVERVASEDPQNVVTVEPPVESVDPLAQAAAPVVQAIEDGTSWRPWAAIAAAGVVVGIGVWAAFGYRAEAKEDEARALLDDLRAAEEPILDVADVERRKRELDEDGRQAETIAWAGLATGLTCLAIGTGLLIWEIERDEDVTTVTIGSTGAGLVVHGRW